MSGGVNSGSVYGMRGGRGYYSRGRGGRGEGKIVLFLSSIIVYYSISKFHY